MGLCKNFIQIFGKNPILWFFPFIYEDKLNGYSFEVNDDITFNSNNNESNNVNGLRYISVSSDKENLLDSKPLELNV